MSATPSDDSGEPNAIHPAADAGYRKRSGTYEHVRPAYHPALVARFVERYGGGRVIELGAGTGKFTRQLAAGGGVETVAVEPVAEMRARFPSDLPGVTVVVGSAERIPVDDGGAATVVAAQAFHWFDHGPALDEIDRVLADGGHLVTVWNVRDNTVDWVAAKTAIIDAHAADTPRHREMHWRSAIDADSRFDPVDDWGIDHPVPTSPQAVVDRALSTSFIAALDPDAQDEVAARILAVVADLGPSFPYPYRGELQAWRR